MSDDTKSSGFDLADGGFDRSGWQPRHGWCGLVPGLSTMENVISSLGAPDSESELLNGRCYDFLGGNVRVTFLEGNRCLSKIWISQEVGDPRLIPPTIDEARTRFGPLKPTRLERLAGVIFERPGMRIACEPSGEVPRVTWMEIFSPRTS